MQNALYSHVWFLLIPLWKCTLAIFITLFLEYESTFFRYLWCLTVLAGVSVYIAHPLFILIAKSGYASHTPFIDIKHYPDWGIFDFFLKPKLNAIQLKLMIINLLSFEIATILHCFGWILHPHSHYLFFLSIFPVFVSSLIALYFTLHQREEFYYSCDRIIFIIKMAFKAIQYLLLLSWMLCISLKYEFGLYIDDLASIILLSVFLLFMELKFEMKYIHFKYGRARRGGGRTTCMDALCYFCCPKCCSLALFITFFVLICTNYASLHAHISTVFIPLWIMWSGQIGKLLLKFRDEHTPLTNQMFNNAVRGITVSDVKDSSLLVHLNDHLDRKRNAFNPGERHRCNHLICDIISPNHVAINKDALYNLSFADKIPRDCTYYGENFELFYQWIPTQFQLTFKACAGIKDTQSYHDFEDIQQFMCVTLKSLFIPDLNRSHYADLYGYITQCLQEHIVPLFARNMSEDDDGCKALLYKWCKSRKILNIIIKSQQYEWTMDVDIDEYTGASHMEGTAQEKIVQIAVLYVKIDDAIIGGELVVSQSRADTLEISHLKSGDIIVFNNWYHNLATLRAKYKSNDRPPIRRILAFFLCEPEVVENDYYRSDMYKELVREDSQVLNEHMAFWGDEQRLSEIPLLTATDIVPVIKGNCDDFMFEYLYKVVYDSFRIELPIGIVSVICEYMNHSGIRDRDSAEFHANNLRCCRGHVNDRRKRRKFIRKCD
eukprot:117106_1